MTRGDDAAPQHPLALRPAWPERAAWGTATPLRAWQTAAITSYFDREHELAMACLSQCGGRKLADLRNPHSRQLDDAPNKSVDRRLAVFAR